MLTQTKTIKSRNLKNVSTPTESIAESACRPTSRASHRPAFALKHGGSLREERTHSPAACPWIYAVCWSTSDVLSPPSVCSYSTKLLGLPTFHLLLSPAPKQELRAFRETHPAEETVGRVGVGAVSTSTAATVGLGRGCSSEPVLCAVANWVTQSWACVSNQGSRGARLT